MYWVQGKEIIVKKLYVAIQVKIEPKVSNQNNCRDGEDIELRDIILRK